MAKKRVKKIVIPLLFLFIFPTTSLLCCCMGEALSISHSNVHVETKPEACHHHDGGKSDAHGHHACDHNSLLSPFLIQQSAQFFECLSQVFKFHEKSLSVNASGQTFLISWKLHDTGPPGRFFSTPLYLDFSTFRI